MTLLPTPAWQDASDAWSDLMLAAQAGDATAYYRLLSELTPIIKKFLKSRLFNPDHVEDVTQEILLAVHTARHTYRPEQPFRNWMYGIARHKMIDFFRKQMRQNAHETSDDEFVTFLKDPANTPEEALSGKDLQALLAKLPEKQRNILIMTKINGHSMAEAATKLHMTEAAAKVTAHRGYKKLKAWLISYGYE
jgi:RNA polymerase sigma-70 factor (ECF subfamily)